MHSFRELQGALLGQLESMKKRIDELKGDSNMWSESTISRLSEAVEENMKVLIYMLSCFRS